MVVALSAAIALNFGSSRLSSSLTHHKGWPGFGMTLKMCWLTMASGAVPTMDRQRARPGEQQIPRAGEVDVGDRQVAEHGRSPDSGVELRNPDDHAPRPRCSLGEGSTVHELSGVRKCHFINVALQHRREQDGTERVRCSDDAVVGGDLVVERPQHLYNALADIGFRQRNANLRQVFKIQCGLYSRIQGRFDLASYQVRRNHSPETLVGRNTAMARATFQPAIICGTMAASPTVPTSVTTTSPPANRLL